MRAGDTGPEGSKMKTTHNGRTIEILARDTDPTCLVWIYYTDEPDTDAFVPANEIVEVAA